MCVPYNYMVNYMGTHSVTQVRQNGKPLVTVYTQYDGYLAGVGSSIAKAFLTGNPDPENVKYWSTFNDAQNLAAVVFAYIMESNIFHSEKVGTVVRGYNVYVVPDNDLNYYCSVPYTYIIDSDENANKITITVNGGTPMTPEEFTLFVKENTHRA